VTSWAMHPEDLEMLEARLKEIHPKVAVECGSGLSTPIMWRWSDSCLTLEHDGKWAQRTFKLLTGLPGMLVTCDIEETPYGHWYSATLLPDQIEFVLIDGPPMSIGRGAALPILWPHLSKDFEIWLDDSSRDHEQQIMEQWQRDYPISIERLSTNISRLRRC
jgi:hypothetical protein